MRVVVAVLAVAALLAAGPLAVLAVLLVATSAMSTVVPPGLCTAPAAESAIGPGTGRLASPADLSPRQREHARTVVAVAEQRGDVPPYGVVVALATVAQESRFQVYANDGRGGDLASEQRDVDRSLSRPHEAIGSDHGSLGLFQQQYPWWGGIDELMDPATSARLFYDALLSVPGWQTMSVTQAAQAVQRSAFPGAYATWEALARQLYLELTVSAGASTGVNSAAGPGSEVICGTGAAMSCPVTGHPAEDTLAPDGLRVLRCVEQEFGPLDYAVRTPGPALESRGGPGSGIGARQLDILLDATSATADRPRSDELAAWLTHRAADLGIAEIGVGGQTWRAESAGGGWSRDGGGRAVLDGGSVPGSGPVRVIVYGDAAGAAAGRGAGGWRAPVEPGQARVSSGYGERVHPVTGERRLHGGTDLAAPTGTPVYAAHAGEVTFAGWHGASYGNLVVLATRVDGGTVETYYAHQCGGCVTVAAGEVVAAGQRLGGVGSTGRSTGPHLHFEVRVSGARVDPERWLAGRGIDLGGGSEPPP